MPDIKDHVTSLEISRKLKEAGVEQDSIFCYSLAFGRPLLLPSRSEKLARRMEGEMGADSAEWVSAFTASELGAMLPKRIRHEEQTWYIRHAHDEIEWHAEYARGGMGVAYFGCADTEADARALLLLDLIAHDHIDLENDDG